MCSYCNHTRCLFLSMKDSYSPETVGFRFGEEVEICNVTKTQTADEIENSADG